MAAPAVANQVSGIRTLLERAQQEERELFSRWQEASERVQRLQARHDELEVQVIATAPVVSDGTAERVRESVHRLMRFTLEELACDIDLDASTVRPLVNELMATGIVRKTGDRYGRSHIFEWVKPTDAGDAFRNQLRLAKQAPEVDIDRVHMEVSGTGAKSRVLLNRITDKDVRNFVQEAVSHGWDLQDGGKHVMLVRNGRKIGVPSTPRDGRHAVNILRQKLQRHG